MHFRGIMTVKNLKLNKSKNKRGETTNKYLHIELHQNNTIIFIKILYFVKKLTFLVQIMTSINDLLRLIIYILGTEK